MPWLIQLAEVARRTGYPVTEVPGWKDRGHGLQPAVRGIVCHHTAGPAGGGDYPSLAVVRSGRAGLPGPLSQFGLGRSGRIYVIAAGRCWHNAPSTSTNHTNSNSIGIEAENNGSQPWPTAQLDAYRKLCAELCREFGLPASAVKAHREVNRGKPDPHGVDMDDFRAAVARLIAGEDDDMSAKDMWTHELKVPFGSAENPEWQAGNVLVNTAKWTRDIREAVAVLSAKLDVQGVAIRELAAALAAHNETVDADALVGRIEAAIERVTIRLDVSDSE
ncbi:peptidoglycan recognition protein family protein [Nonomuraea polychroma]|uniref:peptidoglycan recognition protein family protein n=1 Tax=Nonomuraea polychroma TaxID=46176 RepID=UPI003D8FBCF5